MRDNPKKIPSILQRVPERGGKKGAFKSANGRLSKGEKDSNHKALSADINKGKTREFEIDFNDRTQRRGRAASNERIWDPPIT